MRQARRASSWLRDEEAASCNSAVGSDRGQRITLAQSAPTERMPGLKNGRSRISSVRPRLLPILLPSRWTATVLCGQPWNVGPAHDRQRTILDDVPTPTDQEVRSIREEVWVASPEPAVGVFTTAGTLPDVPCHPVRRHNWPL